MQRLQFDVFVTVVVNQRDGVRSHMLVLIVLGNAKIGHRCVGINPLVAVIRLVEGGQVVTGVQSVFVTESTNMPMSVRTCHPGSQQGYTDEVGNSLSCLAELIQHCLKFSSAASAYALSGEHLRVPRRRSRLSQMILRSAAWTCSGSFTFPCSIDLLNFRDLGRREAKGIYVYGLRPGFLDPAAAA